MYKSAAASQHDRPRTGSHATKPFANGRIDVLPPGAKVQEEVYADMKGQLDSLIAQHKTLAEEAHYIKERLKFTIPRGEYLRLESRRGLLAVQVQALQDMVAESRRLAINVGADNWRSVFAANAKAMLPHDIYKAIVTATDDILSRRPVELKVGMRDKSDQAKQSARDSENRRRKKKRFYATQERVALLADNPRVFQGALPDYYKK